jgi:hypothetical protein
MANMETIRGKIREEGKELLDSKYSSTSFRLVCNVNIPRLANAISLYRMIKRETRLSLLQQ